MIQPAFARGLAVALVVLAGAAGLGSSACLESPLGSTTYSQAVGTNNKTYDGTGTSNHDFSDAVQASAAHDIPCPITAVKAHWVKDHDYVAEGCGARMNYTTRQKFAVPWRVVLASRAKLDGSASTAAPMTPATTPVPPTAANPTSAVSATSSSAPTSAAGCTKDTDCKGERICISAMCVDPPPKPAQP